jgi:tetratricopeptide (TPR) repeat protein/transcriptional regulator with XRE-family HTH domain
MTQATLAEKAGLGLNTVADQENGRAAKARPDTATRLADALGLAGLERADFIAVACGSGPPPDVPVAGLAAAKRTLLRDIDSFVGREPELAQLAAAAADALANGVVGVCRIDGMAGIGKTAFAVRAAHRLASQFPDGQIFMELHGHTPGRSPVTVADALASLLEIVGVHAGEIPRATEARAALWRDRTADKRLIVLLDDAADSDQVQPLIPGNAGNLVIITSRPGLIALEDSHPVSLETLTQGEAGRLFIRLATRPGLESQDQAVGQITELCGGLPLAVGILGRWLRHHRAWSATDLAADLAAARDRLAFINAEAPAVAAAFDLSYQKLTADEQRLFRRLGLHVGDDIDLFAAAALDDSDLVTTRRRLNRLFGYHLLNEPDKKRYSLHALIREYARSLVAADRLADNDAAVGRLLGYYLHMARAADEHIPARSSVSGPDVAVADPGHTPELASDADALAWLRAERSNLQAASSHAAAAGQPSYTIAMAAALHGFLRGAGHWQQAAALHRAAREKAAGMGDPLQEAAALNNLGDIERLRCDYESASDALTQALQLAAGRGNRLIEADALRHLGAVGYLKDDFPAVEANLRAARDIYRRQLDALGEAFVEDYLGTLREATGDYLGAEANLGRALELYRQLGHVTGEANALNHLGIVQTITGHYAEAAACQERALELYREQQDRLGQANALNNLSGVHLDREEYEAAAACLNEAFAIYVELKSPHGQANALNHLGILQAANGEHATAIRSQRQALSLYRGQNDGLGEAAALKELGAIQLAIADRRAAAASLDAALNLSREHQGRLGEAEVLNKLGGLSLAWDNPDQARTEHEQALAIATAIGCPLEQARALEGIGRCHVGQNDPEVAIGWLQQALDIYEQIKSPCVLRVRDLIQQLHTPPSDS